MRKLLLIVAITLFCFSSGYAQWLPNKSCNTTASEITEHAIAHMVNLESPFAVGMANAALIVDPDCGTAELIKINLTLSGQLGDQEELLESFDTSGLSETELAFHSLMVAALDDWQNAQMEAAENHPNVPLFQLWAAMSADNQVEAMTEYTEEFPDYASPAYNMISYSYTLDEDAELDLDFAIETIEKAIAMHNGPNAYDSRAEHYAEAGDFENAFRSQIQALNFASGPSAYTRNAGIYWRTTNKEAWADSIQAYTEERIEKTMMNDMDGFTRFMPETISMIGCNSNMNPCMEVEEAMENDTFTWNEWEAGDIEVYFNEAMDLAITTFENTGRYTMNDSGEEVDYHTRASEVWYLEGTGWKLVHSNFAPMPDGEGTPRM